MDLSRWKKYLITILFHYIPFVVLLALDFFFLQDTFSLCLYLHDFVWLLYQLILALEDKYYYYVIFRQVLPFYPLRFYPV